MSEKEKCPVCGGDCQELFERMNCTKNETTCSKWEETELSLDDLRELYHTFKRPQLPPSRKIGKFERLMNRLGWYRQTEFIVIDWNKMTDRLKFWPIAYNKVDNENL